MTGGIRRALGVATVSFLAAKLSSLLVNLVVFPTLRPRPADAARARRSVQILVPMRDEVSRLAATVPGLLASGADEVVYLDDESTDGSADLVRTLAARLPDARVRVIAGEPRPTGWTGKTWACDQLQRHSDADILIYVDADVTLRAGAVDAILAEMDRQRADVFSVFSRHLVAGAGLRLTVPLITDVVLCFLPFPLLAAPVPAAATAHGAVLAFRRSALERLGGFGSVRHEVVEDVAIAHRTRRLGLQLGLALGGDLAQVRMYETYADAVTGLGRGLRPVAGGSRAAVLLAYAWHLLAYTVPLWWVGRSALWTTAAALGVVERLLVEAKTGGRDWTAALAVSASPLVSLPIVLRGLRSTQVWKGRSYS